MSNTSSIQLNSKQLESRSLKIDQLHAEPRGTFSNAQNLHIMTSRSLLSLVSLGVLAATLMLMPARLVWSLVDWRLRWMLNSSWVYISRG